MPHPKVKISDNSGNEVSVTNNRLDVNATIGVGASSLTTYPQDTASTSGTSISTFIGGYAVTNCKEIIIQADFDNASYIMIGDGEDVTDDTEGIRLHAGDIISLPISSTANVSVSAPDGSQKFNVAIIT